MYIGTDEDWESIRLTVAGSFKRRDFSNRVEFSHLPLVKPEKAMEVLKPGEDSLEG